MAKGDVVIFEESMAKLLEGDWASTDHFYVALITDATPPTADFATPALSDFTEVTPGGEYSAGGIDMGTYAACVTEAAGVVTFKSLESPPTWAQDASNPTDASYGIIYNTDSSDEAVGYVDLGGEVDMTAGALTITWNASGIFTITKAA